MIFYNSLLAKWFLGKGKKHYFMLGWFFFTRYKYLEVWEDMELRIHAKQYWECFSLTLIPALILSLLFSWWCMMGYSVNVPLSKKSREKLCFT